MGGETFIIHKEMRPEFTANAGDDKELNVNETIVLTAEQINEAALYNWYDTSGNFVYQGTELTVSADVSRKYKLEVIAYTDGYKDYDEVEVKLKPSAIELLSPNPASEGVAVDYTLNGVSSAYLMIVGQYGTSGISNNYILDIQEDQITVNTTTFENGFYTVALICDGIVTDAKTLIIN
jgi:hypothetical protein